MRRRRGSCRHKSVWKYRFIKDDMTSHKALISKKSKTNISLVLTCISQKNAGGSFRLKFVSVVRLE
jgi:hypothetical protein